MSNRRPTGRDRLEREYLALARERSEQAVALAETDKRLAAMQREIERVECPRLQVGQDERGPRKDALDAVPEVKLSVLPEIDEENEQEACGDVDEGDWRIKALRMTALLVGVCNLAVRESENQPKLVLHIVKIAADLPGAHSMRMLAEHYGLSPERISQRVEEVQKRFNLPKNQHNKSAEAVAAYRVNATLIKQPRNAA